jgi:hypothetical protein
MPRKSTIVLALVLVIVGAVLRLREYFVIEQMLLKLLITLALAIFVYHVLTGALKKSLQNYKDLLFYMVVIAILCGFSYEPPTSNRLKNLVYIEKLSGIIHGYIQRHNKTPTTFDEALADSDEVLPNRGDADGNPFFYIRLSDRVYVLRTFGPNGKNNFGLADDIQINYVKNKSVSFEELLVSIDSMGTPEEKDKLAANRTFFQGR